MLRFIRELKDRNEILEISVITGAVVHYNIGKNTYGAIFSIYATDSSKMGYSSVEEMIKTIKSRKTYNITETTMVGNMMTQQKADEINARIREEHKDEINTIKKKRGI